MPDIINLNKVRKLKAKQQKSIKAAENRLVYGISTKIRNAEKKNQIRLVQTLEQKVRQPDADNKKS